MADKNLIDSNNSLTKHISIIKHNNKIASNQDNNGQQLHQYQDHEQSQLKHNNNNNNSNNNINFNSSNNNLNNNVSSNNNNNNMTYPDPPDGGTRAWLIMISAFYCNSILFGIINTYGTIYLNLRERLVNQGDLEASSKASLPGSLTIGTTFLLSLVSGILIDKIGLRKTTFIGGCLASSGLLLSAVFYYNVKILYLTYGILFGLGAAFTYTPTLAILGHYFKKYLGLVSGFVTAGSSLFTIILPKALYYLLTNYGLSGTFAILGTATLFVIMCAMIYKPLQMPPPPPKPKPGQSSVNLLIRSLVHVDNWKRKKYIVWALSIPIALFGYFVPYVHMGKLVEDTFPESDKNLPIMCIGITSGLGRLLFGFIADLKGVNRILLQQLSFFAMGILTMAIPLTSSFTVLLMIALGMGLVDGCFITLLGPIAYDLCGPRGATQAIGFLLSLCSIPLTIGSPIAGMLYDKTNSYTLSFILAGIPPIIGGMTMFLIRFVKDDDYRNDNALATDIVGDDSTLNDRALNTKLVAWNKDEKQSDLKLLNVINESTRISLQSLDNTNRTASNRNSLKQSANDFDNEEMEAAEKLLNDNEDNKDKQWIQKPIQNQEDISNKKLEKRHDSSDENHQQKSTENDQPDLSAAPSSSSVTK